MGHVPAAGWFVVRVFDWEFSKRSAAVVPGGLCQRLPATDSRPPGPRHQWQVTGRHFTGRQFTGRPRAATLEGDWSLSVVVSVGTTALARATIRQPGGMTFPGHSSRWNALDLPVSPRLPRGWSACCAPVEPVLPHKTDPPVLRFQRPPIVPVCDGLRRGGLGARRQDSKKNAGGVLVPHRRQRIRGLRPRRWLRSRSRPSASD